MDRRLVWILAAVMAASGLGLPARGAVQEGMIRICLDYRADRSETGEIVLFRVADSAGGDYRLQEAFGGGMVKGEDVFEPELASWLMERAGAGGIHRLPDADGDAVFSNLEEGLYLAAQLETPEEYEKFVPFLIPIPYGGLWEVEARPKTGRILAESPKTGDHPAPLLAAMGLILSGFGLAACVEKLRK